MGVSDFLRAHLVGTGQRGNHPATRAAIGLHKDKNGDPLFPDIPAVNVLSVFPLFMVHRTPTPLEETPGYR